MDTTLLLIGCSSLAVGAAATASCFLGRERRVRAESKLVNEAAADAAHTSEAKWRLLYEQSPLSVQIFRPDGQTKRVNAAWRALFRRSEESGLAFNVLEDPDLNASGAVNLIRQAFEGQVINVPPVPYPVSTEPPEVRWIGGVLYPVKDREGRVLEVVTVHHDITETKRAEEAMQALNLTLEKRVAERTADLEAAQAELHRALEKERELGEMKSRFVGMVSHEFRTPLGVTMSAVEVLRHYDDKLPPDQRRELCDDIHSATKEMAGLMEHMLVLGRVEAGKVSFKPLSLDFVGLLEKCIEEQNAVAAGRCPIELEVKTEAAGAVGDETLLRHIFGNLISNAVKYSRAGESVRVCVERKGSMAQCSIVDRGIGIPPEDQATLFESFTRASNVGDIPGTGLGLVIVKRCVEYHQGSIALDSVLGEGSTFTVSLPLFGPSDG